MASIILSTAGAALGSAVGGPVGGYFGAQLGRIAGGIVDGQLFGSGKHSDVHGPRLTELSVQTSTYGKMIPVLYGTVRIAGNIIWSRPIDEHAATTTSSSSSGGGKGGGGGRVTQTQTTYTYTANVAVAICEGVIDQVYRIWADAKQLDMSGISIRMYNGSEAQTPDSLIQAFEGTDSTPAYRGLAYVVFENFPLGDYGNRIPNFTFEVKKQAKYPDYNGYALEDVIHGMTLIPGAGEFVYDTVVEYKVPGIDAGGKWIQQGDNQVINMHNSSGQANVLATVDELQRTCPNINWISVVVSWFGDNLDASACIVKPGVEFQSGAITSPESWAVSGYDRSSAKLIIQVNGSPQYGGTPDDGSVLRLLDHLRVRGYNIMFYPMLFMDVSGKPWRGLLTGSAIDVSSFFTKTNGYNAFIQHYANLVAGKVDAFIIGSELIGLTKVTDAPGNYPAVNQLVSLAASVKSTLGSSVKITYAADWSEYHHTDGGWYNMDPLWASPDIDIIGIDAYFPLTDTAGNTYDIDTIKAGWTSGEGFEWYYTDDARTVTAPLSPAYAWKNIEWFWSNTHINPDSVPTAWVPNSKKIWFTEYGFPSVDNASNQPNVFYDPTSINSAFPRYSKGRVDFRAQRVGLMATVMQWAGSPMIERMFIWTWDARPYPYWPDLTSVWSDGNTWKTGHWTQGKLGITSLAAIVKDICVRAGLEESLFDVSRITDQVEGFVITSQQSFRETIEQLAQAYIFDCVESDYTLKFVNRAAFAVETVNAGSLVPQVSGNQRELLTITRSQEIELPKRINVIYLNRLKNYQPSTQYAQRETTASRNIVTLNLPVVFSDQLAANLAEITLLTAWVGRTGYQFQLPVKYAQLEPADIIDIVNDNITYRMRITEVKFASPGILRIAAIAEDPSAYDAYHSLPDNNGEPEYTSIPNTAMELLDLPAFPSDSTDSSKLRIAARGYGRNWRGAAVFRSDDNGANYERIAGCNRSAVIGASLDILPTGIAQIMDDVSTVIVTLLGDAELQSASVLAVLNGANAALLGEEIIQFTTATLIEPHTYLLSGLLRGRLGTEYAMDTHETGERFILLDGALSSYAMPSTLFNLPRKYRPVTIGNTLTATPSQDFTYAARALRPYSPVHVTGMRDSSSNLFITWVRRTRIGGEWQDNIDIPLSETSEGYEIDVLNGSMVVRTITGLTLPAASYSAAEQVVDFGAIQSSISIRIYQLSARIGRGIPAEVTL